MKAKLPLTLTIALVFYALTDILIWQRIFEAHELWEFADAYHAGWFVSLGGYAALGAVFLWPRWKDALFYVVALFVAAFSGLEDVLYYLLDFRHMPAALPWLGSNPMILGTTAPEVVFSALLWLAVLVALAGFLFGKPVQAKEKP